MNSHTTLIPSREDILDALRASKGSLSATGLAKKLSVSRQEQQSAFAKRLAAMVRDGQLQLKKTGHYALSNKANFVSGQVIAHRDGYGFVIRDEHDGDDIYLPAEEMQKVMHHDRVLLRITGTDRKGRSEGHIVEVVKRSNTHVIGKLIQTSGVWLISPEDKRLAHDILLDPQPKKPTAGQIVSVEITRYPDRYQHALGHIVEILGDANDPGMEIEIAVRKFGVPHQFSEKALAQAAVLPESVRELDLQNRVDLRDLPLVTIDGEDARDFDDAVYCEPLKTKQGQEFRLIVAIADVSHYVKEGEALDHDALLRSTSVYFPRRVIPMLPEKLSNGLCSLNPQVDRCVLVCDVRISASGEIKAYQFYPALMYSAARLTYTQVAAMLSEEKSDASFQNILPHIKNLYALYKALYAARKSRGAIDFDTTETAIVCNSEGKIEKILPRTRNDAHRLIEECMLTANVCAADLLERNKHPALYRIHAAPSPEKLKTLRAFLKLLGLQLPGGDSPQTKDYAALAEKIKSRPDASLLQTVLLRSMQQAVYSADNIGHFGLAYPAYTHFTSPIRRYPDLLVHRAIKAILLGRQYVPKIPEDIVLNTASAAHQKKDAANKDKAKDDKSKNKGNAIWNALGQHCSSTERRADEASRDVEAWLKCYFMRNKLGESFTGTISTVTSFGIFVQLDQLFVEGLVHVTELGKDYFKYDEVRHELIGEHTGKRYRLMQPVRIQVARVDLEARKIDFCLSPS